MIATSPRIYAQCGLRIRSEIELHLPHDRGDRYDIDVAWGDEIHDSAQLPPGEQIAVYETDDAPWYVGARTDAGYVLRFRECGEFRISADLDRITVHPDPDGRHEILPVLLAGTTVSFVLALRGATVLHASAIAIDGRALAFVGQSGRGKTTMAALLCADGAALVTDDVLVVEVADGDVQCVGGASELRLRDKAASGFRDRPEIATRLTEDDRIAYTPDVHSDGSLPLAGIVVPSPTHEHPNVEIETLDPGTALFEVLSFPRIEGWSDPAVLSRDLTTIGALANAIPIYEATIPWGPPFSPRITEEMRRLLARS